MKLQICLVQPLGMGSHDTKRLYSVPHHKPNQGSLFQASYEYKLQTRSSTTDKADCHWHGPKVCCYQTPSSKCGHVGRPWSTRSWQLLRAWTRATEKRRLRNFLGCVGAEQRIFEAFQRKPGALKQRRETTPGVR